MTRQLRGMLLFALAKGAVGNNLRGEASVVTNAQCHTAVEGEQCHTAVKWAMEHGITLHPDWYGDLTATSSFEAFQAHFHAEGKNDCPEPCEPTEECHTAVLGEECYTAAKWAMEVGIVTHPDWYPGMTAGSPFAAFQEHLYRLKYDDCPKPCRSECHTAIEGEECFTAAMWAKTHGIRLHPEWYPGLKAASPFEDFQARLYKLRYDNCPAPCEADRREECHTAVKGEQCYTAATWAMDHGIELHPEWYPTLTADSHFEAFQAHLHALNYDNCPLPCMPAATPPAPPRTTEVTTTQVTTTVATTTEATTTEATTTEATTTEVTTTEATTTVVTSTRDSVVRPACSLSVIVWDSADYTRKEVARYSIAAGLCERVPGSSLYVMAELSAQATSCWHATLGRVKWYGTSKCSGPAASSMVIFTDGDTNREGCKNAQGANVDGGACQGRWAPYVPTTPTMTTTPYMCTLTVNTWTMEEDPSGSPYGSRKYLPRWSVKAGDCVKVANSDKDWYVTSSWPQSSSWMTDCRHKTLGTVGWFETSDCTGAAEKKMQIFTDGDTTEHGCLSDLGAPVAGASCQGTWA